MFRSDAHGLGRSGIFSVKLGYFSSGWLSTLLVVKMYGIFPVPDSLISVVSGNTKKHPKAWENVQ